MASRDSAQGVPGPASIGVGEELPVLEVRASIWDVQKLALVDLDLPPGGYDWGSPHNDRYAREVLGYRGGLVHGITIAAYTSEMLGNFFGPDWLENGSVEVRFINGVVDGDTVRVHGRVTERARERAGERVEVEVWTENVSAPDAPAAIGRASCLVTPR